MPPGCQCRNRAGCSGRGSDAVTTRAAGGNGVREWGVSRAILIASCEAERGRNRDDRALLEALRGRGASVTVLPWNASEFDGAPGDLCVIRSTWDYPDDVQGFERWGERQSATRTLVNPFSLVAWNLQKDYLLELELRGVPVLPTRLLPAEAGRRRAALEQAAEAFGNPSLVVKPCVGNNGNGVLKLDVATGLGDLDALPPGRALFQPYAAEVAHEGELALVWLDGEVTHGMRKRPAAGSFLVHEERGGTLEPLPVEPAHRALAERVIDALPLRPCYARIDCLGYEGALTVSEVELIEPELYLDRSEEGRERFAAALLSYPA